MTHGIRTTCQIGLICLSALTLFACASPTYPVYGPASVNPRGTGYQDLRIENDRWQVIYTAPASMPDQQIQALALRRATELVISNDYEWFTVVAQDLDRDDRNENPVRVHGGISQSFGSFSGTRVGLGVSLGQQRRSDTILRMEIIAGRGDRPEEAIAARALSYPGN